MRYCVDVDASKGTTGWILFPLNRLFCALAYIRSTTSSLGLRAFAATRSKASGLERHITVLDTPSPMPAGPAAPHPKRESAGRSAPGAAIENSLLAAIPREEYRRLRARLEPVTLSYGQVLYEPGETIGHVYFPASSLVSLLTLADGHLALEVGLIGRDCMVGLAAVTPT
mgnify:CR=1 FL=1